MAVGIIKMVNEMKKIILALSFVLMATNANAQAARGVVQRGGGSGSSLSVGDGTTTVTDTTSATFSDGFVVTGTSGAAVVDGSNLRGPGLKDTYNCKSSNLTKARAGIAGVLSGYARTTWLHTGDSTAYGTNALMDGSMPTSIADYQVGYYLSKLFNGSAIPANSNGFFGAGSTGSGDRSHVDDRITLGGGWFVYYNYAETLGGGLFALENQSTSETLSFTPDTAVDTFKVYYATTPYSAVFSIDIDGGTPTNIDSNGSSGIASATITDTLGTHTLNIKYVSGASKNVYIVGIEAYNSAIPDISIMNAGREGAKSVDFTSAGYGWAPFNVLPTAGQSLTIFSTLGINDMNGSVSAADYKTNMHNLVVQAKTSGGDVILVTPNWNYYYDMSAYIAKLKEIADEDDVCLIDTEQRWVSYAASQTFQFMRASGTEPVHPSLKGYADEAVAIYNVIMHP